MFFPACRTLLASSLLLGAFFAQACHRSPCVADLARTTPSHLPQWPFVMPTPQEVAYGSLIRISGWNWSVEGLSDPIVFQAEEIFGAPDSSGLPLVFLRDASLKAPEEYWLSINRDGAEIRASGDAGFAWAIQSIRQLQFTTPEGHAMVRTAMMHDWPAFPVRGMIKGPETVPLLPRLKSNLIQYPGGRHTLSPERRAIYVDMVNDSRRRSIRFLAHEGWKGAFWDPMERLDFTPESYAKLLDYYRIRFDFGAREFTVAFDDMEIGPGEGESVARFHAEACRKVYDALRDLDPEVVIFFCPVPYGGTSNTEFWAASLEEGIAYLETIGRELPPDVEIYWTGRHVFSPEVANADADNVTVLLGRKPFFWDNDCITWLDRLQPLHGRPNDFVHHVSGYVGNLAHRTEALLPAHLPVLLTIADYLWNPEAYDPEVSLQRAIRFVAGEHFEEVGEAWKAAAAARSHNPVPIPADKLPGWLEALKQIPDSEFGESFGNLIQDLAARDQ